MNSRNERRGRPRRGEEGGEVLADEERLDEELLDVSRLW
jgi:hypothetical protein